VESWLSGVCCRVLRVDCPLSVIDTWFMVVESWLSGVCCRVLRVDCPVSVTDT
jgi:hypothetical protein